jgi:hypothetical protein
MDTLWRTILWQQFGAAIDMLENALVACPDELWSDRSRRPDDRFRPSLGRQGGEVDAGDG